MFARACCLPPLFSPYCPSLGLTPLPRSQLALPNFQGSILDCVWRGDAAAFRRDVALLVLYSLASGLFGGLRSLCFNLVGRRLAFEVRNKLFFFFFFLRMRHLHARRQPEVRNKLLRSILCADTAFFDAAATGDLTSRLAYDVANMLQPVQTLLSSVVENSALLLGSVVACCLQSWQARSHKTPQLFLYFYIFNNLASRSSRS